MPMLRGLEYSLLTSYSHCCRSCGNICASFPRLLPSSADLPSPPAMRAHCATRKWMALHFRRDEAGPEKSLPGYVASIVKRYKRTRAWEGKGRGAGRDESKKTHASRAGRGQEQRTDVRTVSSVACLFKCT